MNVIGLDLSLSCPGIAVAEIINGNIKILETAVVNNRGIKDTPQRLRNIADKLVEIRDNYHPQRVIIERGFYAHAVTTEQIFKVHGIAELVFCNYPIIHYTPTVVKKCITGNGKASKSEMIDAVNKLIYPKIVADDNEADALGLIFCYLRNGETK